MSSNSSLSTMQRLVEQLKLEAGVERIRQCENKSVSELCESLIRTGFKFGEDADSESYTGISRKNPLSCFLRVLSVVQVSQAAAELQQYCMQNACKDALLVGVPAGSNPFREPRSCALL
ncbi:hypothetical protein lerEdw1_000033 [Lerista edwardsae]|nr:hypothetical protein lerEdw1_000033 [Lerista edwardsae]